MQETKTQRKQTEGHRAEQPARSSADELGTREHEQRCQNSKGTIRFFYPLKLLMLLSLSLRTMLFLYGPLL